MPDQSHPLILKRSTLADAAIDEYEALCQGRQVGRIYKDNTKLRGRPWPSLQPESWPLRVNEYTPWSPSPPQNVGNLDGRPSATAFLFAG